MRVLLIHGLARTPLSLAGLARAIERAGHTPRTFGYFAVAESYDDIRTRLVAELSAMAADRAPVGLVGHSLGGLLLRHALADVPSLNVHRLIMLGTPNQSPRTARLAARWGLWRIWSRSCGELLASPDAYTRIPVPRVPYTVIAGTGGWLNPKGPFGDEPNDGFVAVSETRIKADDAPSQFPVLHTFMMNDPAVQTLVVDLLRVQ
jgi:pimeloyl-ACP methyl ester carboxylesterase